jgi:hypothetical protein
MNTGVATNQSPLSAGHTNWAKELRSLGFEPTLAGYTDIASDPRGKAPGDPANHMFGELDGLHTLEPIGRAPDNGASLLAAASPATNSVTCCNCACNAQPSLRVD